MNNETTIREMYQKNSTTVKAIAAVYVGLDVDNLFPTAHETCMILVKDGILNINEDREIVWA